MGKRGFLALAAAVCALSYATTAKASISIANLTSPAIYGSGNSNILFTVDREASLNLELGLRAHTRYPASSDNAAGVMSLGLQNIGGVDTGVYGRFPVGGFTSAGAPGGPRGSWNFDFSINTNTAGNGTGGNTVSSYTYRLDIDYDPGIGTIFNSVNPLTFYGDNEFGNNVSPVDLAQGPGNEGLFNVTQNSRNLGFFGEVPIFNPNIPGAYDVRLTAFNSTGAAAGSVQIRVLVGEVPEPMSFMVWGLLGLAGTVIARRRSR